MIRIAVLDYGMGNLRSVEKALERVGAEAERTFEPDRVQTADGLILPGVGAFPRAMARIDELGVRELVADRVAAGTPVLGICLGYQLLFSSSTELGGADGLGLVDGPVRELESAGLKVPHMGWEPVRWERESELTDGIDSDTPFYFVHSFTPVPREEADVVGTAQHGERFACVIARPPLYGVQFHPEKSSAAGLQLLRNFVGIAAAESAASTAAGLRSGLRPPRSPA